MIEQKAKEKDQVMKKKGGFRLFSRSSKNMEDEMKKELQAKSSKKIDIESLEDSRKAKIKDSSRQQQDFRHLLKKTNASIPNALESRSGNEKDKEPENKKEKRKVRSRQSSTEGERVPVKQESKKYRPGREKDKGRNIEKVKTGEVKSKSGLKLSSSAAELTGSWDYIPSAPTSTVQLGPTEEDIETGHGYGEEEIGDYSTDDIQQGAWNDVEQILSEVQSGFDDHDYYHEEDYNDDDDNLGDLLASSPPSLNLPLPKSENQAPMATNNQDFDFETHF